MLGPYVIKVKYIKILIPKEILLNALLPSPCPLETIFLLLFCKLFLFAVLFLLVPCYMREGR